MTTHPPAGWYPDPLDPSRTRYWDGAEWANHSATGDPFASPVAQPGLSVPNPAPHSGDPMAPRSRGLSTGGVVGIVASIMFAVIALVGALVALYVMTTPSQSAADSQSSGPAASQSASASSEATTSAGETDTEDLSLPFVVQESEVSTTWMLRYDFGTFDVPSSARDVTRSTIERLKGDTSYIGGVWSFDGLSWTATESYLYTEVWNYDGLPPETLEQVADAYYSSYYADLGFDVTPIALETHPMGYEMASLEITGFDDSYLASGATIPVRYSIVLVRDGEQEVAMSMVRLGASDESVLTQWDGEFDATVESFRFWEDIES